ncbi:MAG: hypothetical protein ACLR23_19720 [Clostridia bacterium]
MQQIHQYKNACAKSFSCLEDGRIGSWQPTGAFSFLLFSVEKGTVLRGRSIPLCGFRVHMPQ